ncbi:DinB family protein [Bacillus salitolerans]|uniref:DinB family protein n=1 Tax=Bacillus salitolerans TaxID=1437434 RepID=A0ABW4LUP7_9BACI
MRAKEVLVAQLKACHNENTWFVSLLNSIKGLTEEQAVWKPTETTNSIFEIINHLIYYNQRYLNRFKDLDNPPKDEDNTFHNHEKLTWNEAVKRINDIMFEWKIVVQESDDKILNQWASSIAHLTIHTTYHAGQILYIRKLQGSWNPEDGVIG